MNIPIVLATDKNYLSPTYITILSMMENKASSNIYDIKILVSGEISDNEKELFNELIQNRRDVLITFIDMNNQFSEVDTHSNYITKATYYRLLLPELLPQYNYCLYLDTDIVVCDDLEELYSFSKELGDEYLIAGVKELPDCIWHYRELGMQSADGYFNAGVIILNLGLIRKQNLQPQMMLEVTKNHLYHDQDILNMICKGKVKYLPVKFNKMIKYFYTFSNMESLKEIAKRYYGEEYEVAINCPVILHYSSPIKPWWGKKNECTELWWQYYEKVPQNVKEKLFNIFLKKQYRVNKYRIKNWFMRKAKRIKQIWNK